MKIFNQQTQTAYTKINCKQSIREKMGFNTIPEQERVSTIKQEHKKDIRDMKQSIAIGLIISVLSFLTGVIRKKSVKSLIIPSIELGAALSFPVYFCKMLIGKTKKSADTNKAKVSNA